MPIPSKLIAPLLLALTLGLAACGDDEAAPTDEAPAVAVTTETVQPSNVPHLYRYAGTVQGARRVPLSTKLMGRVTDLTVDEGDRVRRGEALLRIDSENVQAQQRQVEAQFAAARTALKNARNDLDRFETLYEQDSATRKELENVQTQFEQAKAQVEALENQRAELQDMLGYAAIASPIDGYVVEKRTEEGAMAAPGQPLVVVETLDALKVVAQVPEQDVNRFDVGDTVRVEVDALDRTLPGRVSEVNPAGHYASRQFRVTVVLDRIGTGLKSGMYAQVLLPSGQQTVTTVPASAVVERGQLTGLYTVNDDGRAVLRWVRLGKRHGDRVEVLSGLRDGERFVANTDTRLRDGQAVTAQ